MQKTNPNEHGSEFDRDHFGLHLDFFAVRLLGVIGTPDNLFAKLVRVQAIIVPHFEPCLFCMCHSCSDTES